MRLLSERNAAKNEARKSQIIRQTVFQKSAEVDFLMDIHDSSSDKEND